MVDFVLKVIDFFFKQNKLLCITYQINVMLWICLTDSFNLSSATFKKSKSSVTLRQNINIIGNKSTITAD